MVYVGLQSRTLVKCINLICLFIWMWLICYHYAALSHNRPFPIRHGPYYIWVIWYGPYDMEHFDADLYTLVTLFSCIPLRFFSFSSPSIDIIPTKSSHLASGHLTVYIRVHTTVVYGIWPKLYNINSRY